VRSNFNAAGVYGSGQIGYGSNGLGATPEQIAHNLVYGGMSPVGSASGGGSSGQSSGYQFPEFAQRTSLYGFDTGGMIGGGSGDTQKVEFFKNPSEKVIIARPDQFQDARSQPAAPAASDDQRPIIHLHMTVKSDGAPPSPASLASLQRSAALGVNAAARAYRGR
jgi:hypothetical protein